MKKNNKGFSLIELIIVIAIMAVLIAIIAPNLTKYLGSSKKQTDQKNLDEVKQQVKNCISDATTNEINVPVETFTITGTGAGAITTTCSNNSFGALVEVALKGTNSKSKVDASKTKIEVKITGDIDSGYDVETQFVS